MAAIDEVGLQEKGNKMYAINFNSTKSITLTYELRTEFVLSGAKDRIEKMPPVPIAPSSAVALGQVHFYKGGELDVANSYKPLAAEYS